MEYQQIENKPFEIFSKDWALVTCGNKEKYNTMTIGWGAMGTLWSTPVVIVFVKPVRYTCDFLKEFDEFTVSFYDDEYKKDLGILGSKSGRDTDKVALTNLHPEFLENTVTFKEAKQTFVLKKIYAAPLDKDAVPEFAHEKYYLDEEEHYMFVGKVKEVL